MLPRNRLLVQILILFTALVMLTQIAQAELMVPNPIPESGFETISQWTYSESDSDGDWYGSQTTSWKTEGSYSYELSRITGVAPDQTYVNDFAAISVLVNFTGVRYLTWNYSVYANTRLKEQVFIDTTLINETGGGGGTGFISTSIVSYGFTGIHTLKFKFFASDSWSQDPSQTLYYRIDNITADNKNIASPTVPNLNTHSNYHNSGSTVVTWQESTDADGDTITYDVKVGTTSGGTNVLNYQGDTDTTSNSFTMTPQNVYYWSVRACDSYGCSDWATESSFLFTNNLPTIPQISFPLNNSHHYNNSINITWNQSTDADGDTITYDFWISPNKFSNGTGNHWASNNWSNETTVDGVTYYLKVRPYDGYDYNSWSNIVQFTENSVPYVVNITLSPTSPSSTDNLTISMNATDAEGDNLTKYYRWYKNGVLNNSWNDTTYLNASGNYTLGDQIYVRGFVFDGYENSSELQSSSVIIGSSNTAPALSGISLNPATKKYNKNITINTTSNMTDIESTLVRLQVYRYVSGNKNYLGNSTWVTPPNNASVELTIPWSDGAAHTIYAQAQDNGNVSQDNTTNLTSREVSATFTSDITAPSINSSTVSPLSVTTGSSVTITITADGKGANISSANVTITRPDYTTVTLTMTCTYTSGDNSSCTRSYTANSGAGDYTIDSFTLTDDSSNSATIISSLAFTATAASSGSGDTGGGGGGGGYYQPPTPATTPSQAQNLTPPLGIKFKNITSGATQPESEIIAKCLKDSLILENECSNINYGIVVEPVNWWTAMGALIFPFAVIGGIMLKTGKDRNLLQDVILYFLITLFIITILVSAGFNMYIVNYLTDSPKYLYTFLSFGLWSSIVAVTGDYYGYKKYQKSILVWK